MAEKLACPVCSAELTFEQMISPATPAQKPQKAYTMKTYLLTLMPEKRLAEALMPIDSMNSPIAVLRTI